jgi:FKBP-type peptidyl-prolyl cis-trans isomerase FklB
MKKVITGFLCAVLFSGVCGAGEKPQLKSENDKINYSVGYQVGGDFKNQDVKLNTELLVKGVRDAISGTPLMTMEEMQTTLVTLKKKIVAMEKEQRKQTREKYVGEGRDFLAANAKKKGVVTLPSGLQYKVLKEGKGKSPTLKDTVTVNYRGTLIDGTEFDSTYREGKPASIVLGNVIPGWKEALPMMKEGDKWQLFIPADLAFGEHGPLADRTVIYEVELLSVKPGK